MTSIKYSEILFYICFGLLFFAKGIGLYDGQGIFKVILVLAWVCLVAKMMLERYSRSQAVWTMVMLVLGGITYYISGEKGLLLNFLMAIGMLHVDERRLLQIAGYIWIVAFGGRVLVSLLHMNGTVYKVHEKMGLGHFFRWGLGYSHPNVLHVSYLILAVLVVLILGKRCRIWHLCILFLGNCFIFLFSVSYTGMLIVSLLLAGRAFLFFRPVLAKWEKILWMLVVPACAVGSIILPLAVSGSAYTVLNNIFNTRLSLARQFLQPDNIHLFGNRLADIITSELTMDNAYVFALVTYGVIPFCLVLGLTIYTTHQLLRRNRNVEALVVVVLAICGLTEPFLYNTSFKNISFLYMGEALYGTGNGKEKIGPLLKWNGEVPINSKRLEKVRNLISDVLALTRKKAAVAAGMALAVTAIACSLTTYPSGYVVRRSNCEDIPKIFRYYGNANGQDDFEIMEDFQIGDKVEYFGGNIVKIERVRDVIKIFTISFSGAVFLYGIIDESKKQQRKK